MKEKYLEILAKYIKKPKGNARRDLLEPITDELYALRYQVARKVLDEMWHEGALKTRTFNWIDAWLNQQEEE